MKSYKIVNTGNANDLTAWGNEATFETIITESEVAELAEAWDTTVDELLEQLYEI